MSSGAGGPLTAGTLSSQAGMGNANSPYTGLPQQTVVDNPFLQPTNSMMASADGGGVGGGSDAGAGMTDELMRLRQQMGGIVGASGGGGY